MLFWERWNHFYRLGSICCNREIPEADSVFDPRQKGLLNQKWLQKKVSHFLATICRFT